MPTLPGQETLVAAWRALAQLSDGAHVQRRERALTAVFPAWEPLNNAILCGPAGAGEADAAAVDLADVFAAVGVEGWALWLPSPVADLGSPRTVSSVAGMVADVSTLVMTRPVGPGLPSHAAVVRTSIDVASRATDEPVSTLADPDGVPDLDAWVLVHDGEAVAGAWSYLHGTDCGLYAIGTVPGVRRRGLAGALTRHVLADAHRRGARTASLQSTPMGEPLYRSLGFTPVGRYEEWVPARSSQRGAS